MAKKWKEFERLVAAIHAAEQRGAVVKWNEEINGRQFDVTIRFKNGFYEYLTVIECKNYAEPVPAEKVDALVTKSRDVGANKAIMVSSSSYQKGALDVARRHNIQLLSLQTINDTSKKTLTAQLTPSLVIYDFRFRQEANQMDFALPEEPGVLRYLMRDILIEGANIEAAPEDLVEKYGDELREKATIESKRFQVEFPAGTTIINPGTAERLNVDSFLFTYQLVFPKDLAASERLEALGLGVDPYLTSSVYKLKDELNQKHLAVDASRLDLGFDTVLEPGKYYLNPHLGFSYYCETIEGSSAHLCLVESLQMGRLIQCQFEQDLHFSKKYIQITDETEIKRLAAMREKYLISMKIK
jgi:hypothetical protein